MGRRCDEKDEAKKGPSDSFTTGREEWKFGGSGDFRTALGAISQKSKPFPIWASPLFLSLSLSFSPSSSQHLLSLSYVTPPPHCFPPIIPSYTLKISHPVLLGRSPGKDTQGFSRITTLVINWASKNSGVVELVQICLKCSDTSRGGETEPAPWRNSLPPGVLWELDEISCSTASDSLDTARGEHLGVQTEVAKPADQGKRRLSDISQNDLMRKRAGWPGGGVTSCWGFKSRHPGLRLKSHGFHISPRSLISEFGSRSSCWQLTKWLPPPFRALRSRTWMWRCLTHTLALSNRLFRATSLIACTFCLSYLAIVVHQICWPVICTYTSLSADVYTWISGITSSI